MLKLCAAARNKAPRHVRRWRSLFRTPVPSDALRVWVLLSSNEAEEKGHTYCLSTSLCSGTEREKEEKKKKKEAAAEL